MPSDPYRDATRAPRSGEAHAVPELGDVVGGKYRIESVLGQGGMGTVFRARHLLTERAVALKWMLPDAGGDEAVQRFLREARAMGRIEHGGVVGVLDFGLDDGAAYLVMEQLRGSSLRDLLHERGPLTPAEAIGLLLPAMEGVEAAHRVGVVHRDLKPENIFVLRSADGTIEGAKVLDFGISKLHEERPLTELDPRNGAAAITRTGVTIGTPSYMSPEQVRGTRDVDARTDIWSLGVILYEMLSGRVPFHAESFGSLLIAIATEEFPPLDEVMDASGQPVAPPLLAALVHQALAKDPAHRHPDVATFGQLLAPFGPPGARFRVPDVGRATDPQVALRAPTPAGGARRVKSDRETLGSDVDLSGLEIEGLAGTPARHAAAIAPTAQAKGPHPKGKVAKQANTSTPTAAARPRIEPAPDATGPLGSSSDASLASLPSVPPLAIDPAAERRRDASAAVPIASPEPLGETTLRTARPELTWAQRALGFLVVTLIVALAIRGARDWLADDTSTSVAPPARASDVSETPVVSGPTTSPEAPPVAPPAVPPAPDEGGGAAPRLLDPTTLAPLAPSAPPTSSSERRRPTTSTSSVIPPATRPEPPPEPRPTETPESRPSEARPPESRSEPTPPESPRGRTGTLERGEF